ncbi:hypothetical protein Misp06_01443 [Microbulbifer sp. NBRC 101763]|uniref:phytase n=1 Tax=Microbulbifer sp. NBRC 101763 TaxID=1113820 RepID=UPI00309B5BB0
MKNKYYLLICLLLSSILGGCDARWDQVLRVKKVQPIEKIDLQGIGAEQMLPVQFPGKSALLIASKNKGVLLLDSNGDHLVSAPGRVETLAIQSLSQGSLLVAAYDELSAEVKLYKLKGGIDRKPVLQYLGGRDEISPQSALCFYQNNDRTHLFTIGDDGLGHEYLVSPGPSTWELVEIRPLYFGEQVNACAVAPFNGKLLFSQPPIGIISMNADAEKDEERKLLMQADQLGEDFGGLWIDHSGNYLWLTADARLQGYELKNLQEGSDQTIYIDSNYYPASVGVIGKNIVVLDEEVDSLLYFEYEPLNPPEHPDLQLVDEFIPRIPASAQTQPVSSAGDAADDPAIWVNRLHPEQSLILGTDKKYGLNIYGLSGQLVQQFAVGRVNNVDISEIQHPTYSAIAAASNRSTPGIDLFAIEKSGKVEYLGLQKLNMKDPYGLCLYYMDSRLSVWVSDKEGELHQLDIHLGQDARNWQLKHVSRLPVEGQVEGCVVDAQNGQLFYGEEDRGIWKLDLHRYSAGMGKPKLVAEVNTKSLVADVEGLALYLHEDSGYLVASSQGNNSYALFSRSGTEFIGNFRVDMNRELGIDASSETDGLAVTGANLGTEFPMGLLVVQDGRNRMPSGRQNFKLVSWQKIENILNLSSATAN